MTKRILFVDDDQDLSELLGEYLENEGFEVEYAYSGEAALAKVSQGKSFDLWIVDIMMPGITGLELLQQVRPLISTPVIMLTGRGDDIDRILGLEMGADDYLSKPANPRELLARIRAVLRRTQQSPAQSAEGSFPRSTLRIDQIELDPQLREVRVRDQPLHLTSAEFNVLAYLMQSAGQLLTKEKLTEQVLHRKLTAYDRAIDVHVSRVRGKLDKAEPGLAERIRTVRGQGYQFVVASRSGS